jgi:hypothetical protein
MVCVGPTINQHRDYFSHIGELFFLGRELVHFGISAPSYSKVLTAGCAKQTLMWLANRKQGQLVPSRTANIIGGKEEYTFGFISSKAPTLISFARLQVSYCNIKKKDSNLLVVAQ